MPHLRAIVQYSGELEITQPGVMTWTQLMDLGQAQTDSELDSRLGNIAANQCANLCYTSGTTGNPKVITISYLFSVTVKIRVILFLLTLAKFINHREATKLLIKVSFFDVQVKFIISKVF